MLRSRGNRSQRPSESTDEQGGSSSNRGYSYGGYPSSSSGGGGVGGGGGGGGMSSPMAVSSGDADSYSINNNTGRGSFLGGIGSPFSASKDKKKSFGRSNSSSSGGGLSGNMHHKPNPFKTQNKNNTSFIILSLATIIFFSLSGMTFHYRKATIRIRSNLAAVERRNKSWHRHRGRFQGGADDDDDDVVVKDGGNEEEEARRRNVQQQQQSDTNPQDLTDLRKIQTTLQAQISQLSTRNLALQNEITSTSSQISSMTKENEQYQLQHSKLTEELTKQRHTSQDLRNEFKSKHRGENNSVIIPGGPGQQARVEISKEHKELHDIHSLEDLEEYVGLREDSLWDKIDLLVERIEREGRREAVEW
jgi:hypothetical protein